MKLSNFKAVKRSLITSTVSISAAGDERADGVEIALHELAKPAGLRILAAPYAGNVIALPGRAERADVLCREARKRYR